MDTYTIAAVGHFDRREIGLLERAAADAACHLTCIDPSAAASTWRRDLDVQAILLDTRWNESEAFALESRAEAHRTVLPIVTLYDHVGDLEFAEAFSWGADDVAPLGDERALLTRLRNLSKQESEPLTQGRGTALVADPDRARRIVLGRVLRNAGYAVTFAASALDAAEYSAEQDVDVVVLNCDLEEAPRPLIEGARATGHTGLWILTCPPRGLRAFREHLAGLKDVTATDGYAPPENVLFVANELGSGVANDKRASARLLYGTAVAARSAGHERDDCGFTYNISAGGLYVRTLAPPEEELAWLELVPPRHGKRVRLVGKIAWRRRFLRGDRATVPPGFGVQIVDGARADLEVWAECYAAFLRDLG